MRRTAQREYRAVLVGGIGRVANRFWVKIHCYIGCVAFCFLPVETEGRSQKTDDRWQKPEVRGQRSEVRDQKILPELLPPTFGRRHRDDGEEEDRQHPNLGPTPIDHPNNTDRSL